MLELEVVDPGIQDSGLTGFFMIQEIGIFQFHFPENQLMEPLLFIIIQFTDALVQSSLS